MTTKVITLLSIFPFWEGVGVGIHFLPSRAFSFNVLTFLVSAMDVTFSPPSPNNHQDPPAESSLLSAKLKPCSC